METKDHLLISKKLIKEYGKDITGIKKLAFILGNIMPDFNIFTYMYADGSKKLGGHSYKCRKNKIRKNLMEHHSDSLIWWYGFGETVHYLCDAFTSSHNENIQMTISEHIEYEHKLHDILLQDTKLNMKEHEYSGSLFQWIDMQFKKHCRHLKNPHSDSSKIIYVSSTVFQNMYIHQRKNVPVFLQGHRF